MTMLRTTILIEEWVANIVRQRFNGNLSKGVNVLLQEHLDEKKPKMEGFGMFKGEDLVGALMKMRRDERKRGAR